MTNSDRLGLTIRLAEPRLNAAGRAFWTHPNLPDLLPAYMARLYRSMNSAIHLMEAALEASRTLAPTCPVAARLVPYWERHIVEETGHDAWLLADMESLGWDTASVVERPPDPDVATLMGTHYFWVHHAHPVALLSYFAVIECDPVKVETLDRVAATTGLPKESMQCFYRHAIIDQTHGADIWRLIDDLPLTDGHRKLLGVSAITTIEQLSRILEDLLAAHETVRR